MLTRAEEQMKAMEKAISDEDSEILLDIQEKFLESMGFTSTWKSWIYSTTKMPPRGK